MGKFFNDTRLYSLFDTYSWYALGGQSRVLWAVDGEVDEGVVLYINDTANGVCGAFSFFPDEMTLRKSLANYERACFFAVCFVVAQASGLCILYNAFDAPRLGCCEKPFDVDGITAVWDVERIIDALVTSLSVQNNCISTACATVVNIINPDMKLTAKGVSMLFDLYSMHYVIGLSEFAKYHNVEYGSEFITYCDTDRIIELLDAGYLLLIPRRLGDLYNNYCGVLDELPVRHVVIGAKIGDDAFCIADASGILTCTRKELKVFLGEPDKSRLIDYMLFGFRMKNEMVDQA